MALGGIGIRRPERPRGDAGYVSSADFHRRVDSARLLRTRSALHARCGPAGLNPAGG